MTSRRHRSPGRLAVATSLGEEPLWSAAEQALWFVDMKEAHLHRHDPATGHDRTVAIGGRPSFILPLEDGSFGIGNGGELQRFDGRSTATAIAAVDMPTHNLTNDATVDPRGRMRFGTMDEREEEATGRIHLFAGGEAQAIGGAYIVRNGPAPDGPLFSWTRV